jgi:hypothetical protein
MSNILENPLTRPTVPVGAPTSPIEKGEQSAVKNLLKSQQARALEALRTDALESAQTQDREAGIQSGEQ